MANHIQDLPKTIYLSKVASTNHYLEQLSGRRNVTDETVVVADFQTAGRGQIGAVWESEAGKNLTFSILFYPENMRAAYSFCITELVALSVKRVLSAFVRDVTIKWPNDVYWQEKKICGILIENTLSGSLIARSIIGVGLNVNQETFRSDAPNPASLKQITGQAYDRMMLLDQFRATFHQYAQLLNTDEAFADEMHREYLSSLYRREGYFLYCDKNGPFEARIHHIEPSGYLTLERKNGSFSRYAFKEVNFVSGK